ncbi:uncharacterized protein L969DRAFT_51873 [Mixia osmundae IAM 14324]|uniref:Uncharacterized protein n=1 Tax=Mixia osmundae (strain CBS 9802 / IAM 14324 / JCM 22182 / KY 12970) TaxID=764103 RepID=G7DSE4_MIXOS|nr:uncharacterized protein L969DRAFT_51873 [Mixia osmundae IAM 14324]KEI38002.1 hypothetical protein L969DRAFT_51873 [Mixia osmundae IAM 14324]GAA93504.1 hypothetical protein E5Q_00145 [Mixia osmundae IAM 14324]
MQVEGVTAEGEVAAFASRKRPILTGHVRKLGIQKASDANLRPSSNLRGSRINHGLGTGAFQSGSAGRANVSATLEEAKTRTLKITRKSSFAFYLRKGVTSFRDEGVVVVQLHALGAAIPMALSLALAIPDALPCGSAGLETQIKTGSIELQDEIIPPDDREDLDIQTQTRTKSTVEVTMRLKHIAAQAVLDSAHRARGHQGISRSRSGRGRGAAR